MRNMLCIKCGNPREIGRRVCKACHKQNAKESAKRSYQKLGKKYFGKSNCVRCKKEITLFRQTQKYCIECSREIQSSHGNITNTYERGHGEGYSFMHRKVAEQTLGRKLSTNEVVHHLNEDAMDNSPRNLIIMTRQMHAKLHAYLRFQRASLEESKVENIENCWNTLRVSLTTAWLEMAGAKVIKIEEIGQSAAEPRSGEGSEAMHDASRTDEDMVQTTTEQSGLRKQE